MELLPSIWSLLHTTAHYVSAKKMMSRNYSICHHLEILAFHPQKKMLLRTYSKVRLRGMYELFYMREEERRSKVKYSSCNPVCIRNILVLTGVPVTPKVINL
jgi:hypothetical protein